MLQLANTANDCVELYSTTISYGHGRALLDLELRSEGVAVLKRKFVRLSGVIFEFQPWTHNLNQLAAKAWRKTYMEAGSIPYHQCKSPETEEIFCPSARSGGLPASQRRVPETRVLHILVYQW